MRIPLSPEGDSPLRIVIMDDLTTTGISGD